MPSQADALAARVQTFADRVLKFISNLPRNPRFENIFMQLIDSASSQSANYRAARRARSRKEFIAKMGLVAEEADESENWLEVLTRAGVANTPARITEITSLVIEARELRQFSCNLTRRPEPTTNACVVSRNGKHRTVVAARQIPRSSDRSLDSSSNRSSDRQLLRLGRSSNPQILRSSNLQVLRHSHRGGPMRRLLVLLAGETAQIHVRETGAGRTRAALTGLHRQHDGGSASAFAAHRNLAAVQFNIALGDGEP